MACYNKLGKCLVAGKDIKPGENCSMDILKVIISTSHKNIGVNIKEGRNIKT